jgi:ubiquinone/menaquinone biosynthesis C-methylase UbiE
MFYNHENRRKWQDPKKILEDIGLRKGLTFMDIGCGNGYFIFPASEIVGITGKVYGLDINQQSIKNIKQKAQKEELKNIILKSGKAEDFIFCENCADIVFFSIVLHDFENPIKVLTNAMKMLKSSGKLINLDWKKEQMDIGPPFSIRFSKETAIRLIEKTNFKVEGIRMNTHHYIIIAIPDRDLYQ